MDMVTMEASFSKEFFRALATATSEKQEMLVACRNLPLWFHETA